MTIEPGLRRLFADLVHHRWGLSFPSSRADRLDAAITLACHRTGRTPTQVLSALRSQNSELEKALIEALVVRETYFFRHADQLRLFRRLVRAGQRSSRLRVWSAGCATGEEPYSLAMIALEELGPEASARVEILATDLSEHALKVAERGRYRPWSFRETEDATMRRWFVPDGDGFRLSDAPRELVRWRVLNVCEPRSATWPTACDVIFLRNVCLYFDAEAIRRVAANMAQSLTPEGLLLTGPSDPDLTALSPALRFDPAAALYRRADSEVAPESGVRLSQTVLGEHPSADVVRPEHLLARSLIDAGDSSAAMRALDRLIDKNPTDAPALTLRAYESMQRFDSRAALTDAVCATDFAPELALAHWIAAAALAELGRAPAALRRLEYLDQAIATLPADALIPLGGGLTAGQLQDWASRLANQLQPWTASHSR